jgi:hypothetical protein
VGGPAFDTPAVTGIIEIRRFGGTIRSNAVELGLLLVVPPGHAGFQMPGLASVADLIVNWVLAIPTDVKR